MLTCCCCGRYTKGKQWWNRDKGFGLCLKCWNWISQTNTIEYMKSTYGITGIHCAIREDI